MDVNISEVELGFERGVIAFNHGTAPE